MFRQGSAPEVFGARVPEAIVKRWQSGGSEQVIAQAELLPVLLALIAWQDALRYGYVIWWAGNDGARQNLVKGV